MKAMIQRRGFFKALGCGMLAVFVEPILFGQESGNRGRGGRNAQAPTDVSAWLHIAEDGAITVFSGKTEVGQNVRTSCAMAVAEELRAPLESIKVVLADTQLVPFDAGTFGSQSTPQMHSRLHRVAAAAREALLDLAADHFKTDRASLTLANGRIAKSGGESIGFGELTKGQKIVKQVDNSVAVTPAGDWKICGTSVPKLNGREIVTGKHQYTSDLKRPGMLYGKVLRAPQFEASLGSADTRAAEALAGVKIVRDGDFIGVAAPDSLTASHALNAIRAEWNTKEGHPSSATIYDYLRANAQSRNGGNEADASAAPEGSQKIAHTYKIAYIAHTPLEPRAAVAEWNGDEVTIWTGTQRPFGVREDVARALGVANDKVRVIVPDTGSGYGGKHSGEAAIEAARLARGAGKPVKLVWSRQEEFTWAYFRPAGVIDVNATVSKDGMITAWDFHNYNSGRSAVQSPYDLPGQKSEFHNSKSPLKSGSYRGLAATANHFARESAMDALAALVNFDPLEFRLKNLKDARLRTVLQAAADAFGWGKQKSTETRGFGIAGGAEKGSYVATCAEVSIDRRSGGVRVVRATTAFECGAIVNPKHLENQVEGAVVMGLGGALFEAITFENGMITNPHLADYRVPRFSDMPKLETVLVNRKDLPAAGAGETPIVAIAPAIGNAIFAATKIRLRALPMVPEGLKS